MASESVAGGVQVPDSPLDRPEIRRRVRELPPSATFVALVLDAEAPLTTDALSDRSLLSVRTVRYALDRLDDAGLIDASRSHDDGRTQVYRLADGPE